jgi:hypothetical protein
MQTVFDEKENRPTDEMESFNGQAGELFTLRRKSWTSNARFLPIAVDSLNKIG